MYGSTKGINGNYPSGPRHTEPMSVSTAALVPQTIDPSWLVFNKVMPQPREHIPELREESVTSRKPEVPPHLTCQERNVLSTPEADRKRSSFTSASILSLKRRFANAHSAPYIEHIASVLRYSSSNSWRSSLISLSSFASSRHLVDQDEIAKNGQTFKDIGQDRTIGLQDSTPQLAKEEQVIWDELIDESQLISPFHTFYKKLSSFLLTRPCCGPRFGSKKPNKNLTMQPEGLPCLECGFSVEHYFAKFSEPLVCGWEALNWNRVLEGNVNVSDYFGNTPLHYLASSRTVTLPKIFSLIGRGACIRATNNLGQTFMHVLNLQGVLELRQIIELIEHLNDLGFPFAQRDYVGRTSIYNLLELFCRLHPMYKLTHKAFVLLEPDLNTVDSGGRSVEDLWDGFPKHYIAYLSKTASQYTNPLTTHIDFLQMFSTAGQFKWHQNMTISHSWTVDLVKWVDRNGDTLLSAILKNWPWYVDDLILQQFVRRLLSLGSELHMRDRRGDTALAIAARRGFRAAVICLLRAGSNIHTRDYYGKGILRQARNCLLQARKEENDRLYAGILSCMTALVDAGAKKNPTDNDEWMTPRGREAVSKMMSVMPDTAAQSTTENSSLG